MCWAVGSSGPILAVHSQEIVCRRVVSCLPFLTTSARDGDDLLPRTKRGPEYSTVPPLHRSFLLPLSLARHFSKAAVVCPRAVEIAAGLAWSLVTPRGADSRHPVPLGGRPFSLLPRVHRRRRSTIRSPPSSADVPQVSYPNHSSHGLFRCFDLDGCLRPPLSQVGTVGSRRPGASCVSPRRLPNARRRHRRRQQGARCPPVVISTHCLTIPYRREGGIYHAKPASKRDRLLRPKQTDPRGGRDWDDHARRASVGASWGAANLGPR